MLRANFSFFTVSAFYWSRDVIILHFCQRERERACNPTYVCILIFCLNLLSYPKVTLDFPMKRSISGYVYMEKFIDPAFPATTKIFFYLLTFYSYFFIFAYLVKFISLIHSKNEQCFYYKIYTALLKKAFNRHIPITNSFKKPKTKKQSYWISDNDIT